MKGRELRNGESVELTLRGILILFLFILERFVLLPEALQTVSDNPRSYQARVTMQMSGRLQYGGVCSGVGGGRLIARIREA